MLKLISYTALVFAYAFARSGAVLISGPALILLLGTLSRHPLRKILSFLKAPLILLLFMSPFILFAPGKELLFRFSVIRIYLEGVALLLTVALRSLTVFGLLALMANGSQPYEAAAALRRIGIPGKLIVIFLSTWRYINLYISDLGQLVRSARLRGFSIAGGITHWSASADILLTLLIRSYEQSERVQAAMITRGFSGELPLNREPEKVPPRERFLSAAVLLFALMLMIVEILC